MFLLTRRAVSLLLCPLALGLILAAPATAQDPDDPLPDVRQRLAVEAQRVEKEFSAGRLAAYRLVQSDPGQVVTAVEQIYTLLAMVERDRALKPERRTLLIVTLKADVRELQARASRAQASRTDSALAREARNDSRRADDTSRTEARRKAHDDLQSRFDSMRNRVADTRDVRRQTNDRFLGATKSVDKSAIPDFRDYGLPDDWAEKSKRRSPEAKLTPQERALVAALRSPVTVDFKDVPFSEVIEYLSKKAGVEIVVDKRALEEVNVTYESTVSIRSARLTLRTVLKKVLADLGLAYIVENGTIRVTSAARARETTTVRKYYVGDLVSVVDVRFPPWVTQAQAQANLNDIVNLITSSIDPQSWKVNNPEAPGAITFEPVTMSLIIRQTAEVHMMLGGGH